MRAIHAAVLLLPLLAACPARSGGGAAGDESRPGNDAAPGGQVTVQVTARGLHGEDAGEGSATAAGGAGTIMVNGRMSAPNPCQVIRGAVAASGRTLTLTVSATAQPDVMCVQSIGAFAYDAVIRGAAPGAYTLRVVHSYPGTGWETRTVFEGSVQVR